MPRISNLPAGVRAAAGDELPSVDVGNSTTTKITVAMIMPTGTVLDYAGQVAPPGFLLCFGQTLNAQANPEYSDLYTAIGNTYGGSSNVDFKVPDLRGRVTAGADAMGGTAANRLTTAGLGAAAILGAAGGAERNSLVRDNLPMHRHNMALKTNHGDGVYVNNQEALTAAMQWTGRWRYWGATGNDGNHIDGGGHDDLNGNYSHTPTPVKGVQPTLILNKIIKY